ncbi:ABC transporter permease [Rhodovulum sp. YNF3179]|uniref:ABC transporter permease n=1 Tax=Rhodovulum sp. YNF3179 TaxID=3425127 RepID=UPI003D34FA99
MADEDIRIERRDTPAETSLTLGEELTVHQVTRVRARFASLAADGPLVVDLGALRRLDTAGAWALSELRRRIEAAGGSVRLENAAPDVEMLLDAVAAATPQPEPKPAARRGLAVRLETIGRAVTRGALFGVGLTGYLGLFLVRLGQVLRHPGRFRLTALVAHCEDVGFRAVPIVAVMAFLIGVVLAFQGAAQLRQFGAEVFVVDLIAISILRELGILLTAIIVAGRTASSFTAAIGSMKMREEIDAMRTLGLDPAAVLFVPRILALILMLPILGLIANLAGLFGGALMSWIELGISPSMFRTRLIEGTDVSHVFVGLVKAPVFAVIIGVVGCHAGMRVQSNAESLGRMTSSAVVTAIFAVILADALFSVFFAEVGL